MKNRKKDKIHKIHCIVFTLAFIYVFSLSFGYAFFSESLTIKGVASTVDYYEGTSLPIKAMVYQSTDSSFVLPDDGTLAGGSGNSFHYYTQDVAANSINFKDETWEDDTYTLHFTKSFLISAGERTIKYSIAFTNPTVLPMTNGTVSTEITENTGDFLKDASTTISSNELQPGQTCTVTMIFHTNISWRYHTETAKATVAFDLQGKTRYLYFIVTYTT